MRINLCIATAIVMLLTPSALRAENVLLYDFETPDQHREPNLPSNPTTPSGWGSFGAITLDRGPASEITDAPMDVWLAKGTYPASAGDWARYHLGDFDLPWDLPGNYGLINVSDRFAGKRKDLSAFTGLSVDAMFLSNASIPFDGVAEIQIGLGFITPGVGVEDESKSVFAPPQLLTDVYQTFTVEFSDFEFLQTPEELAVDLAQYAFIKLRVGNTEFNSGLGILVYDEVYGIVGETMADDADFNNDGAVDGADFLVWQRGFGMSGQTSKVFGDADASGVIDGADLEVWKNQFGTSAIPAVAAVPECSSFVLAMLAATSFVKWTRGNRSHRRGE